MFGQPRQQKGLEIAATAKIVQKGGAWLVPSQSGKGRYTVIPHDDAPHCTCPDHQDGGHKCKHLFAVEYVLQRETKPDGTVTITAAVRKTYVQDWRAYNAAQTGEKVQFLELLRDLCSGVTEPERQRNGRPRLPIQDVIFAACFKVYSTVSARRFMSDLRDAQVKGFISKAPHYNSIFNYLENPSLTPLLRDLIIQTSLPLKSIETDFACDSSGFTTSRFVPWFDDRYGTTSRAHEWVKVHLMCGVRTNIVTAVEIKDKDASDTKLLPALVDATAKNFELREVSADKGYASLKNYKAI